MSERIITVRGKGNVSERPDLVEIGMKLESKNYDYERAMTMASQSIQELAKKVESLGFDRKELKTTSFAIDTDYEGYRDAENNYHSRFVGYLVGQQMNLSFDFDSEKLGKVLKGISETSARPELTIRFSVKDKELLEEKLLADAAKNARRRAELLTEASGAKLGDLLSIDYDWSELQLYSDVRVESNMLLSESYSMPEIEPENVEVGDTVRFRWEIK